MVRRLLLRIQKQFIKKKTGQIPSLPSDLSFSDMNRRTKRGFLACKISHFLQKGEEAASLFYQSMNVPARDLDKEEENSILRLSEQMLCWHEMGENIPDQIKEHFMIPNEWKNAMLRAYEIYKRDLFAPLSEEVPPMKNQSRWEIYRDVMYAFTQGRFLLIRPEELNMYKKGHTFLEGEIRVRTDIPKCRNSADEILEKKGFPRAHTRSWLLALSEAITNALKHAEEGHMTLVEDKESNQIRFIIEDRGPGFPLDELPKYTLMEGYSTKQSMGQGFTLMMRMASRILLATSDRGSALILVFDFCKEKEMVSYDENRTLAKC